MAEGAGANLAPGGEILDTQGAVSLVNLLMKFVGSKADPAPAAPAPDNAPENAPGNAPDNAPDATP